MLAPRAIRFATVVLLALALTVPGLAEALASRLPRASACLCADHACCTFAAGAACPTSRGGRGCAAPRAPTGPGLRAGCGCHHDAPDGTLAPREPALLPHLTGRLDPAGAPASMRLAAPPPTRSLARAPEPPPPRTSLPSD